MVYEMKLDEKTSIIYKNNKINLHFGLDMHLADPNNSQDLLDLIDIIGAPIEIVRHGACDNLVIKAEKNEKRITLTPIEGMISSVKFLKQGTELKLTPKESSSSQVSFYIPYQCLEMVVNYSPL